MAHYTRLISAFTFAAVSVASCLANTFVFTGGTPDGNVNASADITLAGNMVTIVLHNLEASPNSPGQMISGFGFVAVDNHGNILTETGVTKETGVTRTLSSDGDGDQSFADGAVGNIDWSVQNSQSSPIATDCKGLSGIQLCALTGAQPDLMIIGPAAADGDYNPNNGVLNFQPYLSPDSATFVITLSGAATSITSTNFDFGTGSDYTGDGSAQPTPEPRWGALFLTMAGGLATFAIRRVKSIRA